jgi:hypothetical protein
MRIVNILMVAGAAMVGNLLGEVDVLGMRERARRRREYEFMQTKDSDNRELFSAYIALKRGDNLKPDPSLADAYINTFVQTPRKRQRFDDMAKLIQAKPLLDAQMFLMGIATHPVRPQ